MGRGRKRLGKVFERSGNEDIESHIGLDNVTQEPSFGISSSSASFSNMGSKGTPQIRSSHFTGGELSSSSKRHKSVSTAPIDYLIKTHPHPQTQTPGFIGANVSYTRGSSNIARTTKQDKGDEAWEESSNDEDRKFLRLAHDALVATARGAGNSGNLIDPTISDLLRRLQYASSPHGNPMKRSDTIRTNKNGQLMVQDFYQKFPDLSNNIFTGNSPDGFNHISNDINRQNGDDWNYLIGHASNGNVAGADASPPGTPLSHTQSPELSVQSRKNKNNYMYPKRASTNGENDMMVLTQSYGNRGEIIDNNQQLVQPSIPTDATRKYLCSKCSQSFRRSSDLKRHEKQHLEIPPNICEQCGKGFARKDALKRHRGTLTCKRNAEKKLYIDNLEHLQSNDGSD